MRVIVAYDIVEDKLRNRVAKGLTGYIERVQKSVFEGEVRESQLVKMRAMLEKNIDQETDTVRIYRSCRRCLAATEVIGTGSLVPDEDEDIVL